MRVGPLNIKLGNDTTTNNNEWRRYWCRIEATDYLVWYELDDAGAGPSGNPVGSAYYRDGDVELCVGWDTGKVRGKRNVFKLTVARVDERVVDGVSGGGSEGGGESEGEGEPQPAAPASDPASTGVHEDGSGSVSSEGDSNDDESESGSESDGVESGGVWVEREGVTEVYAACDNRADALLWVAGLRTMIKYAHTELDAATMASAADGFQTMMGDPTANPIAMAQALYSGNEDFVMHAAFRMSGQTEALTGMLGFLVNGGSVDAAWALMAAGADPESRVLGTDMCAIHMAEMLGRHDLHAALTSVAEISPQHTDNIQRLFHVASAHDIFVEDMDMSRGDTDLVVDLLVNKNVATEAQNGVGERPLGFVCSYLNVEAATVLLAAGADPNGLGTKGPTTGVPPLTLALMSGAAVNAGFPGATKEGVLRTVELLLAASADPSIADSREQTPLHYAAGFGFIECTALLLAAGADANVHDDRDATPLSTAMGEGTPEQEQCAILLVRAGADAEDEEAFGGDALIALARAEELGWTEFVDVLYECDFVTLVEKQLLDMDL